MSFISIALQVIVLTLVGAAIVWAINADKKRQSKRTTKVKNSLADKIFWIVIAILLIGVFLGFASGWK